MSRNSIIAWTAAAASFVTIVLVLLFCNFFAINANITVRTIDQQASVPTATTQPQAQQFAIKNTNAVVTETNLLDSIPVGTIVNVGDSFNGVTIKSIVGENKLNSLIVRQKDQTKIISFLGYNGKGSSKGGQFSATTDQSTSIVAIVCWDNDPKEGEFGWSITTTDGRTFTCPVTADHDIVRVVLNPRWDNVDGFTVNAGGDSGGISIITTTSHSDTTTNVGHPIASSSISIETNSNVPVPASLPKTAGQIEAYEADAIIAQTPWLFTKPIGGQHLVEYMEYNN